jgi:hypothetical protein
VDKEYFLKTEELVVWRPTGILTPEKIHGFVKFLNELSQQRDPHFSRFIDLSQISGISVKYNDLSPIAKQRSEFYKTNIKQKVKMAFFTKDPLTFGMARMYQMLTDDPNIQVLISENLEEISNFFEVDISVITP